MTYSLDFLAGVAEGVVFFRTDVSAYVLGCEGLEVGEAELDALEAGGGDGFEFEGERVRGCADGDGCVAGWD